MEEEELTQEELEQIQEAVECNEHWNQMFQGEYQSGTMQKYGLNYRRFGAGKVKRSGECL